MEIKLKWLRVGNCVLRHDQILDVRTTMFMGVWGIRINLVGKGAMEYGQFDTYEEALIELTCIQKELQEHD